MISLPILIRNSEVLLAYHETLRQSGGDYILQKDGQMFTLRANFCPVWLWDNYIMSVMDS